MSRKSAFLARSVAHRTVSFIESEVEQILASSQFLQDHEPRADITTLSIEDLELGNFVGRGAFSEVYRLDTIEDDSEHDICFSDSDEEPSPRVSQLSLLSQESGLVVKHLRKDLLSNRQRFQSAAADLVREAQYLSRLDHAHIIQLRGWAEISALSSGEHDSFFLVMDQLDCTLADKIQGWKEEEAADSRISHLETKLRYARELASALEYLHQHRLVFRDLKPENIGILDDSIVLFDFGLIRELPASECLEEQFEMSGVGTLGYMAPETLSTRKYNQQADVYSFSMVLYELLFHKKPFEMYTLDMYRLFVCEEEQRPKIPSFCPPHLQSLLQDAWDAEPSDRPCFHTIRRNLISSPKSRLASFLEASQNRLKQSFSFGASDRTSTTMEDSSIGSWFVGTA